MHPLEIPEQTLIKQAFLKPLVLERLLPFLQKVIKFPQFAVRNAWIPAIGLSMRYESMYPAGSNIWNPLMGGYVPKPARFLPSVYDLLSSTGQM